MEDEDGGRGHSGPVRLRRESLLLITRRPRDGRVFTLRKK
jgi:hypothetical protein